MHGDRFRRLVLVGLAGLLAGLTAALPAAAQTPDPYDYCRSVSGPHIRVLIDTSDPFDDTNREVLREGVTTLLGTFGGGEKLSIETFGSVAAGSREVFRACVPKCPPNLGFLTGCNSSRVRQDLLAFKVALERNLEVVYTGQAIGFDATDLTGTLRALFQGRWGEPGDDAVRADLLVVFSDFLEHRPSADPAMTFYGAKAPFGGFLRHLEAKGLLPHLDGVQVVAFGLDRPLNDSRTQRGKAISPDHWSRIGAFWRDYFQRAGARPDAISIGARFPNPFNHAPRAVAATGPGTR